MAFNGTFSKLSIPERQALLDSGERRRHAEGDLIIRQGTLLGGIYVVTAGEVRVEHGFKVVRKAIVKQPDGTQKEQQINGRLSVEVTRLGRGAIFGEMSFVDDSPTSASVAAVGQVETRFIPMERVREKLEHDSGFAKRFYHSLAIVLSNRLREANQRARGGRPTPATARSAAASEMGLPLVEDRTKDELPPLPPQPGAPRVQQREAPRVAQTRMVASPAAGARVTAKTVRQPAAAARPESLVTAGAAQRVPPKAAPQPAQKPAARPAPSAQTVRRPAAAQPAQAAPRPAARPAQPTQAAPAAGRPAAKPAARPQQKPAGPARPPVPPRPKQ